MANLFEPVITFPIDETVPYGEDLLVQWLNYGVPTETKVDIYNITDNSSVISKTVTPATNQETTIAYSSLPSNKIYSIEIAQKNTQGDIIKSEPQAFKVQTKPTLTFTKPVFLNDTYSTNNQNIDLEVSYAQAEGINIKNYWFVLYDENDNIVEQTEKIFDFTIKHYYENLTENTNYKIECFAETQTGLIGSTGKKTLQIGQHAPITRTPSINAKTNLGVITLDWSELVQYLMTMKATSEAYVDGKFNKAIKIGSGGSLTLDKIRDLDDPLYTFYLKVEYLFHGDIIEFTTQDGRKIRLSYDTDNKFKIYQNNNLIYTSVTRTLWSFLDFQNRTLEFTKDTTLYNINEPNKLIGRWLFFSFTKDRMIINFSGDISANIVDSGTIPMNLTISAFEFKENLVIDHIHAYENYDSNYQDNLKNGLIDTNVKTEWTSNTELLGTLDNTLESGNIISGGVPITGYRIRRKNLNTGNTIKLADINDLQITTLNDTTAIHGERYEYSVHTLAQTGESAGQLLDYTPSFGNFNLCSLDGKYNFLFDSNLDAPVVHSAIGNNKTVTIQKVYANKPVIVFGEEDYHSGQITCIPYKIINDDINNKHYADKELLKELKEFFFNEEPKVYKNTLGDTFYCITSNFNYNIQNQISEVPFTITFQFIEIDQQPNLIN